MFQLSHVHVLQFAIPKVSDFGILCSCALRRQVDVFDLQLSPALQVVVVKLPRQMTTQFSKYEQSFTDCAGAYSHKKCDEVAKYINPLSCVTPENCLLRFIQLALLDSEGGGRMISCTRACELGADAQVCE